MKLHVFTNRDKDGIKEEHDMKNLANHIRSSRILLVAPPGCGKTNTIFNLIVNQSPAFDKIYIFHIDASTQEYESLNAEIITDSSELPTSEEIDPHTKILVIFEDVDFSSMKQKDVSILDRYLRYNCTHKGLTLYLATQNYFTIPVSMRRKVDVTYFMRADEATMSYYARNLNLNKKKFQSICDCYLQKQFDSICVDFSHPIKLRHNIFTPITIN